MKSQAHIVGYVLLVAAITGIAFGVYFWGKPLLEKSQAKNYASSLETMFTQIADMISETANKRVTNSYTFELKGAHIVISPDQIVATINIPYPIYSTSYHEVPVNTKFLFECDENMVKKNKTICKDQTLRVNLTDSNIILTDTFHNKTLTLSRGNYTDVIFSKYVFDIKDRGNAVYFIPKEIVGVEGLDPACIVTANARTEAGTQVIRYTIKCRTMYDPKTGICYKIQIEPSGITEYVEGSTSNTLVISYESSEYVGSLKSTLCNSLKIIKVKATFT